jgi:hypothetical protein
VPLLLSPMKITLTVQIKCKKMKIIKL